MTPSTLALWCSSSGIVPGGQGKEGREGREGGRRVDGRERRGKERGKEGRGGMEEETL